MVSRDLWSDEVGTTPGTSKARIASEAPPADLHVAVGQLMAAVARLDIKVTTLAPLSHEVSQLRRDIELDRGDLVKGAASGAAKHSSNRLALLMGGLFTLYEASAPTLHELWKVLHR